MFSFSQIFKEISILIGKLIIKSVFVLNWLFKIRSKIRTTREESFLFLNRESFKQKAFPPVANCLLVSFWPTAK